jgi:hypothetical protein
MARNMVVTMGTAVLSGTGMAASRLRRRKIGMAVDAMNDVIGQSGACQLVTGAEGSAGMPNYDYWAVFVMFQNTGIEADT